MYSVTGFGITKATQLWVCLYGCFQGNLTKVRRLTLNVGGSISWSCPRLHKERGSHVITNMALSLFPIPPRRDEVRASHIFLLPYNGLYPFETRPQVNSPSLKILLVPLITWKVTRIRPFQGSVQGSHATAAIAKLDEMRKPKKKRNNYKHSFGAMTQDSGFPWGNLQSWPSNGTANQSQLGGERHQLALITLMLNRNNFPTGDNSFYTIEDRINERGTEAEDRQWFWGALWWSFCLP